MKSFTRQHANLLARTARQAVDFSRWLPNLDESNALLGLERALSVSIQAGQPELEAMQDRLILAHATDLETLAKAAYAAGRIADASLVDEQVFGCSRNRLLDVIDVRQPVGEIVDVSYLRRNAAAAAPALAA